MEPTLTAALVKLVVGASGSIGGKLGALLWTATSRDRRRISNPEARIDLQELENDLLSASLTELVLEMPASDIYEFATSPVAGTFTEQLILLGFAGARPTLERAMRDELRASMSAYLRGVGRTTPSGEDARAIFDVLSELSERAVAVLKEGGYRLAEEATQRLHNLILELYVSSIDRNIRLLSGLQADALKRNEDFLQRLRQQVAFRYRHIQPPDFERIVRIPIDDLYVTPSLSRGIEPSARSEDALDLGNFASGIYRTVALGSPGGGKSTLSAYLAHAIGKGAFVQGTYADKTPLIIVLRDLRLSESGSESILQYIEAICESAYALRPPQNGLEYGLLNGRFLLIFDGLDELLDPASRAKVVEAIEAIANLYPDTRILVTSRRINYDAAPLDAAIFEAYSLNEFDAPRIEEYAHKSFGQLEEKSIQERRAMAGAFLRESGDHAAEIRSNPLVLALMCRLYRGENYIPQNIPSLYERCATMLFITWDARRHIGSGLPFEYHIEPLMAYLAYWFFESDLSAVGERSVIMQAKKYLQEWVIQDAREAEVAATAFIRYFKDRLWVFTEVGISQDGESIYAFTHRTFLEYFAGMSLSTNATSSIDLAEELLPRLTSKQWDVVAQVAVYLRTKLEVHAADEIIGYLLHAATQDEAAHRDLLSFINRLLAFVVPRPDTLSQIVHATLDDVIADIGQVELEFFWSLFVSLARSRSDNRPGITRCIEAYVRGLLNSPPSETVRNETVSAVGAVLQLPDVLRASIVGDANYSGELVDFWKSIADVITDIAADSIRSWAAADESLALIAWRTGALGLGDLAALHGSQLLFRGQLLAQLIRVQSSDPIKELEEWYDLVIDLPTPWLDVSWIWDASLPPPLMFYDVNSSKKAFSSVVLIITALFEAQTIVLGLRDDSYRGVSSPNFDFAGASLGDLDGFKDVLLIRRPAVQGLDRWDESLLDRRLESHSGLVTNECVGLLREWATGRVNLCHDPV